MDDPLSAVDPHVGKQIFENCIRKMLRNQAVIFVTHQLQVRNRMSFEQWKKVQKVLKLELQVYFKKGVKDSILSHILLIMCYGAVAQTKHLYSIANLLKS